MVKWILLLFFSLSCSDKLLDQQLLNIKVAVPTGVQAKTNPIRIYGTTPSPTSLSNLNCFALYVSYPPNGPAPNPGSCEIEDVAGNPVGGFPYENVGGLAFRVSGTNTVEIALNGIPQGAPLNVSVVGYQVVSTADCIDITTPGNPFSPGTGNVSSGHVLTELFPLGPALPGETKNISGLNFDLNRKIKSCGSFQGPGGGGIIPHLFPGTGADGNVVVTSGNTNVNTDTSLIAGKVFSASRRVMGISNTGQSLTLISTFASNELAVNDEVMFWVTGEGIGGDCGYPIGDFFSTRVTAISGTILDLATPIPPPFANTNAHLAAGSIVPGTNFCRAQVLRVPNVNNLTINAAASLVPNSYTHTSGVGGIVAVRVAGNLSMVSGGSIDVSGDGYAAGAASLAGVGFHGLPTGVAGFANGGTSHPNGGGGGAHRGFGGLGDNAAAFGGMTVPFPSGGPFPLLLGGGGGSDASANTGNGGGAIMLTANSISGDLVFHAQGVAGATGAVGGGGGAGGQVNLFFRNGNATSVSINTNGGDGGTNSTTIYGGGGGAGKILLEKCSAGLGSFTATLAAGNSGGGSAQAGGNNTIELFTFSPCPF